MRLVSSKTLLTLATALVAVPGAAIAAAEPGEPLFQIAASDTAADDCEEHLEAPEDEEADEVDSDETTADVDDTAEDDDAVEAQDVAEECEDDDAGTDADADGDGTDGTTEDDELTGDDDADGEGDEATGEDADEEGAESPTTEDSEDAAEVDDDTHGEIVSAVAACAPRGQERVDGFDLPNHGAYVSAAAKGETLEVGEGYDLSTLEGATALCDQLDAARDAGGPEDDGTGDTDDTGTDGTTELETSDVEESAPARDAPAGPATGQQRGGESGPPEQAGNAGGGKGKGPQDAPGRNR